MKQIRFPSINNQKLVKQLHFDLLTPQDLIHSQQGEVSTYYFTVLSFNEQMNEHIMNREVPINGF